jgi:hypothetical protein
MRKKLSILFSFLLILLSFSCNNENEMTTSHLKISLIDQAGDFESVNIDIQEIRVHSSSVVNEDEDDGEEQENGDGEENDNDSGGWVTLEGSDVGVVNILEYTNNNELTIYDSEFPAGYISQIRLVLGDKNTVVIDGDSIKLTTPSGEQSGLKLNVHENLEAGLSYYLKLDFEAARSIIKANEKYLLKPVIRVIKEGNGGSIKGEVFPESESVSIIVLDATGAEKGSTIAQAESASFLIPGIEAGTYSVSFEPAVGSDYASKVVEDVVVEDQQVTVMEPVNLDLK